MPETQHQRPSPEQLLRQVEEEERDRSRGKLKIFLGYASLTHLLHQQRRRSRSIWTSRASFTSRPARWKKKTRRRLWSISRAGTALLRFFSPSPEKTACGFPCPARLRDESGPLRQRHASHRRGGPAARRVDPGAGPYGRRLATVRWSWPGRGLIRPQCQWPPSRSIASECLSAQSAQFSILRRTKNLSSP